MASPVQKASAAPIHRPRNNGELTQEEKDFDYDNMKKGMLLLKFGKSGAEGERMFTLSGDHRYLSWKSKLLSIRLGRLNDVDMEKVIRIQHGQMTVPFQKVAAKFGPVKQNSFSIIYTNGAGEETSLDLIAPTPDVFKYWFEGLKIILKKVRYVKENASVEERYYKLKFEAADTDRSGTLDVDEVVEIIYGMNIDLNKSVITKMIEEVDVDKNGTLDFDEFSQLLTELRRRPELEALWVSVVAETCKQGDLAPLTLNMENNAEAKTIRASTITTQQFMDFWSRVQGDDLTPDEAVMMIKKSMPPNADGSELSFGGFSTLMTSSKNDVFDYEKQELDTSIMSSPLSHYFIASSHNTYLEGNQLTSNSSVNRYINDLMKGCRCVELDCWDGDKGEPIIYHGHTLTSKIMFADVIAAIKQFGFSASPYPIVLSVENHCSHKQQQRMAEIMVGIFKKCIAMPGDGVVDGVLPSPEYLRGKILIKGKKLPPSGAVVADDDDDDEEDEDDEDDEGNSKKPKKEEKSDKKEKLPKIAQELSDITYLGTGHVKQFGVEQSAAIPCDKMCSYSEFKTIKQCKKPDVLEGWLYHNRDHLSRIYPAGTRVDSSNYDPTEAWSAGAQMVALNYQTISHPMAYAMHVNDGKYRENGKSGYILKPEYMLNDKAKPSEPITITIHMISAQQIPKPGGAKSGEVIDPYVVLTMGGVKADRGECMTKVINNNGFNPCWNEVFTFPVTNPDCAHLTLRCMDKDLDQDDFIAQSSIPVSCLKPGWRMVQLFDANSSCLGDFEHAKLFVRISIEPGIKASTNARSPNKK